MLRTWYFVLSMKATRICKTQFFGNTIKSAMFFVSKKEHELLVLSKILFCHSNMKFISSCPQGVISSMYKYNWRGRGYFQMRIFRFIDCYFLFGISPLKVHLHDGKHWPGPAQKLVRADSMNPKKIQFMRLCKRPFRIRSTC